MNGSDAGGIGDLLSLIELGDHLVDRTHERHWIRGRLFLNDVDGIVSFAQGFGDDHELRSGLFKNFLVLLEHCMEVSGFRIVVFVIAGWLALPMELPGFA